MFRPKPNAAIKSTISTIAIEPSVGTDSNAPKETVDALLLTAAGLLPPRASLSAAAPAETLSALSAGIGKLTVQVSVAPAARLAAGDPVHTGAVAPAGRLAAFRIVQTALSAGAGPLFVQVAVQVTVVPGGADIGVQLIRLIMSAPCTVIVATALSHAGGSGEALAGAAHT